MACPTANLLYGYFLDTALEIRAAWPFLLAMKDSDEVEAAGADAVGNHVWSAGNDEFPRAGKPARPARMRLVHEPIDALDDLGNYAGSRFGIVFCFDVAA